MYKMLTINDDRYLNSESIKKYYKGYAILEYYHYYRINITKV